MGPRAGHHRGPGGGRIEGVRGRVSGFRANASLRPPVTASQLSSVLSDVAPTNCKHRQKSAQSRTSIPAEWRKNPPARMSHSRHLCRSIVFANTPETVCFLPLVCEFFLAAIRANMQSHPLYLTPAPFPATPRIALFRAITGTCAPILTDHRPSAGRGACPQRAEYLAPICPTSPPGTKPPGNLDQIDTGATLSLRSRGLPPPRWRFSARFGRGAR